MAWWSEGSERLRALTRRGELEAELEEEIRLHIEMETEANLKAGMEPAAARREALRRFGGVEKVKEDVRDERGVRPLEDFVSDIRFAGRSLRKAPGFTTAVVLTLALGIGANTAIFSVLNGVVLRPLDFPYPDRLVQVCEEHESVDGFCTNSFVNVRDFTARSRAFERLGSGRGWPFILRGTEGAESVRGGLADAELFRVFGVSPVLGRGFVETDLGPDADPVVLLSHTTWRTRFGGDPDLVGSGITIDDQRATVVGVLPPDSDLPGLEGIEIWRPIPFDYADISNRNWRGFKAIGRLRPAVSVEDGVADLRAVAAALADEYPDTNAGWGLRGVSLHEAVVGGSRRALNVFMGAVGFVLLIGCANVANLLMARSAKREREFAVRRSLGAGRGRLARMLLAEGLLLAVAGASLGLLLAVWGVRMFVALAPAGIPRVDAAAVDGSAILFTAAVAAVATVVVGVIPAARASRPDLVSSLRTGPERGGRMRLGARGVLVTAEVALSLVLLVGAGLLARAFAEVAAWDPGFEQDRLVTFWALASDGKYETGHEVVASFEQIAAELEALPSVVSVGTASAGPLFGGRETISFQVDGSELDGADPAPVARWYDMDPGYFRTLGIPLLQGRYFDAADDSAGAPVAIVNRTLASRFFAEGHVVGGRIELEGRGPVDVVGVVADVRPFRPDAAIEPEIYWPIAQRTRFASFFVLRTSGDPASVERSVRTRVASSAPDVSVSGFRTMEELVGRGLVSPRFNLVVLAVFAAVALCLAAIGIYGVIAYNVSRRTHEIGLRKALGADRERIVGQIVRQGFTPAAAGLALGLAGSLALTRLMSRMLYGVRPTDPSTLIVVTLAFALIASVACWIPARRAAALEPMEAMRVE
jgi:predicted permease